MRCYLTCEITSREMNKEIRKDSRFKATKPDAVRVSVRRADRADGQDISGVLLDLSRGGLRLRIDETLPVGTEIELTLSAPKAEVEIQSSAIVRWTQPAYPSGWVVGCSLDIQIEESSVQELASIGALERRLDSRRAISFHAEAKTELDQTYKPFQVVNLSAGGFCGIGQGIGAKLGDALLIRIPGDGKAATLVKSRVVWVEATGDAETFGCTFVSRNGRAQMQAMLSEEENTNPLFAKTRNPMATRWILVGAFIVFIATVLQSLMN